LWKGDGNFLVLQFSQVYGGDGPARPAEVDWIEWVPHGHTAATQLD
jgi:hypothetical protein